MSWKLSTGLRNHLMAVGSLRNAMHGNLVLKIFGGTVPASANDSIGGATLLRTITVAGDGSTPLGWEAVPADGVLQKALAETWQGVSSAGGIATFCRFETLGDAGASSTSLVRMQGVVAQVGGDLNLTAGVTLVSDVPTTIAAAAITLPAQ